jgi:DinB family protein
VSRRDGYRIVAADGRSTEELVAAGRYEYAHSCVSSENFPARHFGAGRVREIVLLEFDRDLTLDEVMSEAARLGLERPMYEDALYFGVAYPDVQRERPVVFLHDPWVGFFGRRDVLCLWSNAGRRELGLEGFDDRWSQNFRFAFVGPAVCSAAMESQHRAILERMRSSAGVLRRAVETAQGGRFTRSPRAGEWSALETLTHVRDVVVHVYGTRIRRLLYEDAPLFADFDEEGYRRASLARGETAADLLDTIVAEQEQLARLLQTLPDAEWSREGRHPSLGVMSIEFLARRVGEHAEEHAAQILAAATA